MGGSPYLEFGAEIAAQKYKVIFPSIQRQAHGIRDTETKGT